MQKRGKVFGCSPDKVRVVRTLNAKYPERKGAWSNPEEAKSTEVMAGSAGKVRKVSDGILLKSRVHMSYSEATVHLYEEGK